MKKTNSFFFKIGLSMSLIIVVLDLVVLLVSYNITYGNTVRSYEKQIQNAAEVAVQYTEDVDPTDSTSVEFLCNDYTNFCQMFGITYVFAVDLDVEQNKETFIAIGFGEGASLEAKKTRYPGVVVKGKINDKELEAYNGNIDGVFSHETSQFGETLICYMPCTRHYSHATNTYIKNDKPIIVGTEISLTAISRSVQHRFMTIAIVTAGLTLLVITSFGMIIYFRVSKPIRKISKQMSSFVTDRVKAKAIEKLEIKGNDEFALMAQSFNVMTDEIDSYINRLDTLTREKHQQEAELDIARRIQMGLLRPDSLDDKRFTIDAYMLPAKDVGGDLYDYQVLDDGRVFVTVADVSGKGISGALFMSRAITLLHQFMLTETSPAKILAVFNDTLAAQNPGGLFITTFLAVWDPAKSELTYSNAGHNFPYILSDSLITLEDAHGVAAGLFEGEEYENATVSLKAGDTLFLYTDGVNEAKNAKNAFYSTERLEQKLSECSGTDTSDTLQFILNDLNSFTHGAEQNDDITMLALHLKPRPASTVLTLRSELSQLTVIKEAIFALDVSEDLKKTLLLAAEEMFVNICSYAYDSVGEIDLTLMPEDTGIALTFTDSGKPFDPTADLLDIDEYDHEHAIGGLGRFLTFSVADRYNYEYRDGKNILYLYFSENP